MRTSLAIPDAGSVVCATGGHVARVPVHIDGPAGTVMALERAQALAIVRVPYCKLQPNIQWVRKIKAILEIANA